MPRPRSAITVTAPARQQPYTSATSSTLGGTSTRSVVAGLQPRSARLGGDRIHAASEFGEGDRIIGGEIDEGLGRVATAAPDGVPDRRR
jgi:hypothetical protein